MKLVLTYEVSDDCTYSCTTDIPFEYESIESAELEFLRLYEEACNISDIWKRTFVFEFCGKEYYCGDFSGYRNGVTSYREPRIRELEEWFKEGL